MVLRPSYGHVGKVSLTNHTFPGQACLRGVHIPLLVNDTTLLELAKGEE